MSRVDWRSRLSGWRKRDDLEGRLIWRSNVFLLLLFAFCLTACSRGDERPKLGINGYLYQSSQLAVTEGYGIRRLEVGDDALCFIGGEGIYSIPLEENMDFSRRRLLVSGSGITDYAFGQDGALYYVKADFQMSEDWQSVPAGCTLVRMAGSGAQEWRKPFPDIDISVNGMCLAADGEGELFLLSEDTLYRINGEGDIDDIISIENYRISNMSQQLAVGEEGKVYYCTSRFGGNSEVWEIYEITGAEDAPLKKLAGMEGVPHSSMYGLLCNSWDGIVYQYKGQPAAWEPVFRWGDSCLNSPNSNTNELVQTDEEHFFAMFVDMLSDSLDSNLYQLTRRAVTEMPEKEILVLASVGYTSDEIKQWVSRFNREDERYHIIIEHYGTDEVDTKLNSRLVSSNPPDLVDVGSIDVVSYGEKQTFADLMPFLEASDVLDKDMFFDRILEAYTIEGRLVCIPKSFYINAVFGRTSEVGSETGWTAERVMALADRYPDRRLLAIDDTFLVNRLFGIWLCEQYIDWESGECTFDSEEFCGFLEWLKTYLDRIQGAYGYEPLPEDCLLYMEDIVRLCDRVMYEWKIGEEITFIGHPTSDSRSCIPAETENVLCITSRSGHKEGAWDFLESFLAAEGTRSSCFSSRQDCFRRELEAEMTPEYFYTEDGEIEMMDGWVDREGNEISGPNMKAKRWVGSPGNLEVLYYYMSQEQADALMEIFEVIDFTPGGGLRGKVLEIFEEESNGYLEGSRSVEEVAEIIQNRVKNLVQENL